MGFPGGDKLQTVSVSWRRLAYLATLLSLPLLSYAQTGLSAAQFTVTQIALPGANGLVTLDYFAYDSTTGRLWVPGGNMGTVYVIDAANDQVTRVGTYATAEFKIAERQGVLGPSSISLGEGVVYLGNRADSKICMIDSSKLKAGNCTRVSSPNAGLAAAPDAVVYIPTTKEVWVTSGAPPIGIPAAEKSIAILDATPPHDLKFKGKLPLDGSAEGYAVDAKRGLFYTNIEESGSTVAIDVRRRTIVSRWRSGCADPRGLALDKKHALLFVACADKVVALDMAGDGHVAGSISTGNGLDNIDYSEEAGLLYAAASDAATLTVAKVEADGKIVPLAVVPTVKGARGVVAGAAGHAYVIDPHGGRILKVAPK